MNETDAVRALLDAAAKVLIRCFLMGTAVLLLWAGFLIFAGDLAYRVHSWTVPISREQFDVIHYAGMMITKACNGLFFLVPWIAIRLMLRKRKGQ